jgi:methylglutaconyl-CoA hydratase
VSSLRVERDGPVLRVTLTRPERRNAFDAALIDELAAAFADVGDARAVVLTGDGPSFSAGADVEWMRSSVELSFDENMADALRLRAMLDAIDGCPAPVIAAVQGHALGGGCGLIACCDIVIAAPDTQFAFSEVKLGIVPAVISPFALAKIGPSAARCWFVTGERFDADVALRIGLIHEIHTDLAVAIDRIVGERPSDGRRDRGPHRPPPHQRRRSGGLTGLSGQAPRHLAGGRRIADARVPPVSDTSQVRSVTFPANPTDDLDRGATRGVRDISDTYLRPG